MPLPPHEKIGEVATSEEYLRLVLGKARVGAEPGWILRGQTNELWPPLPKIDRSEHLAYRERQGWSRLEHEERLMTEFELGARPHVKIEPRNPWEWLAVAQHYGLATRLLD